MSLRGVYIRARSPFYWLRFYDKLEPATSRRRKSVCTKVPITDADAERARIAHASHRSAVLVGTPELRRMVADFRRALAARDIAARTGIEIKRTPLLSEAFREFKRARSIPGMANQLKARTLGMYDGAVAHLNGACPDKAVHQYREKDYEKLLFHFEELGLGVNTRSIYTRALRSLWNYFVEKKYASTNIIKPVAQQKKDPEPIPLDDMADILAALRTAPHPHHFQFVSFMLLTGCRPSTAIVQTKDNIDMGAGIITLENVKTGRVKLKNFYPFPIHAQLAALLNEIGVDSAGRLFPQFKVNPQHYTYPLTFWERKVSALFEAKKIRAKYTLKQIRPTFISYAVNVLGLVDSEVQRLVDHSDIRITQTHYLKYEVLRLKPRLDQFQLLPSKGVTQVCDTATQSSYNKKPTP